MLTQYNTLTKCMLELKKSVLPIIVNLKLALLLIQIKRILLNPEVEARIINVASSEEEFFDVYKSVRQICSQEGTVYQADLVILKLQNLKIDLTCNSRNIYKSVCSADSTDEGWFRGVLAK